MDHESDGDRRKEKSTLEREAIEPHCGCGNKPFLKKEEEMKRKRPKTRAKMGEDEGETRDE